MRLIVYIRGYLHMLPLKLAASLSSWRLYYLRLQDKNFRTLSHKLYEEADYTCAYCGFKAYSYLSIVNQDGNYLNNRYANLKVACPFCAQCGFIENVGVSGFGGGSLIYMPEITQSQLNMTCHSLFAALCMGGRFADVAKASYRDLKLRSKVVENNLGKGMSRPATLGQLMMDAPIMRQGEHDMGDLLKDLRLLPAFTSFTAETLVWSRQAVDFFAN